MFTDEYHRQAKGRTRVLSQDLNAQLERAPVLAHEVPVQQVRV